MSRQRNEHTIKTQFYWTTEVRLWDVQTGRLLQTFSKHSNDVNDVSFSPDGKSIASASSDKTLEFWQLANQ